MGRAFVFVKRIKKSTTFHSLGNSRHTRCTRNYSSHKFVSLSDTS
uniref:Uncharacterized protein n=1 Tax=Rhizophora mucronata TaxID=61149 RepID=A0A2P2PR35_RHIMU